VRVINESFFNEFTLLLDGDARSIVDDLAEQGILPGVPLARLYPDNAELAGGLLIAVTETSTREDIEVLAEKLEECLA
jgi:glycine dehydrogenase subunit 1